MSKVVRLRHRTPCERRRAQTSGHRRERLGRHEPMDSTSPESESDNPVELLAEYFERIESEGGLALDEEEHRLIVETIRMDRDLHH